MAVSHEFSKVLCICMGVTGTVWLIGWYLNSFLKELYWILEIEFLHNNGSTNTVMVKYIPYPLYRIVNSKHYIQSI